MNTPTQRKRNIFIVGTKRAGTTIFWESFRQDGRFVCFDEPFHPKLRDHVHHGQDNRKGTFAEYLERRDLVSAHWSAIQPHEELLPGLLGHQHAYIQALTSVSDHVCIDFVRGHARIADLRRADPSALIVHLVRDPRSVVTSHLKPYGRWISAELPNRFFDYQGWFDYWQYQTLAEVLGYRGRAVVSLLLVWRILTSVAIAQTPDVTVRYEDFASSPDRVLGGLYARLDLDYHGIDAAAIHSPRAPHAPEDPRWNAALQAAGITGTQLAEFTESPARVGG